MTTSDGGEKDFGTCGDAADGAFAVDTPPAVGRELPCRLTYTAPGPRPGQRMAVFVDDEPNPQMSMLFEDWQSQGQVMHTLKFSGEPGKAKVRVVVFRSGSVAGGYTFAEVIFFAPLNWTETFKMTDHTDSGSLESTYIFNLKP